MKRIALLTAMLMMLSQTLGAWAMGVRCASQGMQVAVEVDAKHPCHQMSKPQPQMEADHACDDRQASASGHHSCASCQFCTSAASLEVAFHQPSAGDGSRGDWPPLALSIPDTAPDGLIRPPARLA